MRLQRAGILVRRVIDDVEAMRRINAGTPSAEDSQALDAHGRWLDGGFYLGSQDLYQWLRDMPAELARGLGMTRISHINELYGGNENLERLQRREARFFNTCMMMTALGVGGQYNFVAMAHALRDGRSVLLLRSTREQAGRIQSSVLWNYGHCTIPRHLRDIVITEYGIADLRGLSDEDCVKAMAAIAEARFQAGLLAAARAAKKLSKSFVVPAAWSRNQDASLRAALAPFRRQGLLTDYPLGCDFTAVEQRLVRALSWLKASTATLGGKARTILQAVAAGRSDDAEAMQRMALAQPRGFRERLDARLLGLALRRSVA
jgi:hypothetical protein